MDVMSAAGQVVIGPGTEINYHSVFLNDDLFIIQLSE